MKKIAIVTGSARGIGFATAQALLNHGYFVVFSDIHSEEQVKESIASARGESKLYISCDISLEAERKQLIHQVIERFGRLDVLVNNAGVAPLVRSDLLQTSQESFDRVLKINLYGTFFMCQEAANAMIGCRSHELEEYFPRIINIASMSSYTSSPNRPEYCVSKAGISMVTKLFADRLADEGILVFEVRPGIIMTDMTKVVKEKYEKMIAEGITPIRRFGMPQDVAGMVLAACSGFMDFTTGQVLNADGGFHIQRL